MEIEQKFGLIVSKLSKKGDALYIGDLAWTLGREDKIKNLGGQTKEERLGLVNEYIANKHYLIESNSNGTRKYYNSIKKNKNYSYIFIDIFHRQHSYFHKSKRVDSFEIEHLDLLSDKGFALVVANEDEFSNDEKTSFINSRGFYLNAVIGLPVVNPRRAKFLSDKSIFFISKQKTSTLFVIDLLNVDFNNRSNLDKILSNLMLRNNGSNLQEGLKISSDKFYTFSAFRAIERVKELSLYYKEYEEQELGSILISIKDSIDVIDTVENNNNGLFVIKNVRTYKDLKFVTIDKNYVENCRVWPYYYIILNSEVSAEYVSIFLQSQLGSELIKGVTNITNHSDEVNPNSIKEIPIFFPSKGIQDKIIKAHHKILDIKDSINEFSDNLSLNPSKFITESIEKLDNVLGQIGKLNETDRVRRLIEKGENANTEYKQTYGLETNSKSPYFGKTHDILVERIFEQMSAFLNSYGGVLLIGVHDNQHVTGMEEELKALYGKNNDTFKLRFNESLSKYLGSDFTSPDIVTYEFVPIDGHQVFQISCSRSPIPCRFGKEERLIVQEDPRIRVLKGEDEMRYISKHFPEYYTSISNT